jgi:hypothetical protein
MNERRATTARPMMEADQAIFLQNVLSGWANRHDGNVLGAHDGLGWWLGRVKDARETGKRAQRDTQTLGHVGNMR